MRSERPRALLSALNYPNVAAALATKFSGADVRFVTSARNVVTPAIAEAPIGKRLAIPGLLRMAFRSSEQVICVSKGVSDDVGRIADLPPGRRPVIYNPVDLEAIRKQADAPLDHPFVQKDRSPFILASGRLVRQKGFSTLLQAFAQVRSSRSCRLVILGEGPERNALAKLAETLGVSRDVCMPGFDDNPYRWMRRASAFAMSSDHEGFPSVLLEAMACGAPVVSTDCPSGPDEILEGGKWGRLVPVRNAQAMADALVAAMIGQPVDVSKRLSVLDPKLIVDQYLSVLLP